MPHITFVQNGQRKEIETESGKTLLQVALDANIEMTHACGGNGFCTTCLCKLESGTLGPRTNQEEMMGTAPDERLGCQATVDGDATVEVIGM